MDVASQHILQGANEVADSLVKQRVGRNELYMGLCCKFSFALL